MCLNDIYTTSGNADILRYMKVDTLSCPIYDELVLIVLERWSTFPENGTDDILTQDDSDGKHCLTRESPTLVRTPCNSRPPETLNIIILR